MLRCQNRPRTRSRPTRCSATSRRLVTMDRVSSPATIWLARGRWSTTPPRRRWPGGRGRWRLRRLGRAPGGSEPDRSPRHRRRSWRDETVSGGPSLACDAARCGFSSSPSKVAYTAPNVFGSRHARHATVATSIRSAQLPRNVRRNFRNASRLATLAPMASTLDDPPRRARGGPRPSPTSPPRRACPCRPSPRSSTAAPTCRPRPGGGWRRRSASAATGVTGASNGRPDHRADLPRARQRVGARDRPRRRARRRPPSPGGRAVRDAGSADPGTRLDRERSSPGGRPASSPSSPTSARRCATSSGPAASRSSSSIRPVSRCTTRRRSARPTGMAG